MAFVACEHVIKADIKDVANWFLLKRNHMTNKKIQKLCYYAQAWSLAKLGYSIATNASFEAWVHGPVSPALYKIFKQFGWKELKIEESDIEAVKERVESVFNEEQKSVLESVWITYGEYSADELEQLTHSEKPWLEQREGLSKFESSHRVISEETMKDYYQSIAIPE